MGGEDEYGYFWVKIYLSLLLDFGLEIFDVVDVDIRFFFWFLEFV